MCDRVPCTSCAYLKSFEFETFIYLYCKKNKFEFFEEVTINSGYTFLTFI